MAKRSLLLLCFAFFLLQLSLADEGMYPISEIYKLNLKAKGLKIDPKAIYNPNRSGLIDAVVQLSGCTGSFVSSEGLIIQTIIARSVPSRRRVLKRTTL